MTLTLKKNLPFLLLPLLCLIIPRTVMAYVYGKNVFVSGTMMKLRKDSSVLLGGGYQPNNLVVIEYEQTYDPFPILQSNVYTRDRLKCNFNLDVSSDAESAEIMSVYQLAKEKVIITWSDSPQPSIPAIDKITVFDMKTCNSSRTLKYSTEKYIHVVYYKDGFDVISVLKKNGMSTRTSYDLDAKQLDSSSFLPTPISNFYRLEVRPVSRGLRSGSIVVFIFGEKTLKKIVLDPILDVDSLNFDEGYNVKHQMTTIGDSLVVGYAMDVDKSLTSVCYMANTTTMSCAQFNQYGNLKFNNQTTYESNLQSHKSVRNLKNGGLVLFDLIEDDDQRILRVTEMKPGSKVREASYPYVGKTLDGDVGDMQVLNYDESKGSFDWAWINLEAPRSISMKSYSLFK